MKIAVLGFFFITIHTVLNAQDLTINWSKSLGGYSVDNGNSICQGQDSSYLVVGYHWSTDGDIVESYGESDIWLVNLSTTGEVNWQKTIGGTLSEEGLSAIVTQDSGYVMCGYSRSSDGFIEANAGFDDCFIAKFDAVGNIIWQKSIGGTNSERATSIIECIDGGFAFTGYSRSDDGPFIEHIGETDYSDLIVGKMDTIGNLLWMKNIGGLYSEEGYQIIELSDSGYLIVGTREVFESEYDYFIVKVTKTGEILWSKTFGGTGSDAAQTAVEFSNDKFWISGYSYSSDGDVTDSHGSGEAWTVVIDGDGNIVWKRSYGGSRAERWNKGVKIDDNTICFVGASDSEDGDVIGFDGLASYPDYWLIALDSLGIIKWQNCFGGTGSDLCHDFIFSNNDNYILTGATASGDGDVIGYHDDGGLLDVADIWTLEVSISCNPNQYFLDNDGDAFGDASNYIYSCSDTIGYVLDNTDCDDSNNLISPAALEVCNTIDDNCNGLIDEDFIYVQQYADMDGDDFGNPLIDTIGCPNLFGFVVDSTDCNDTDPSIHPGATEILNGIDDDCNQIADDGLEIIETEWIGLSVFPSPATNELTIQFENINTPLLTVYNINGDLIFQQNKIQSPFNFDASELSAGLYLIYLYAGNLYATTVFVKD